MFKKAKLKKQIKKCHERIEEIERKRSRSQAALVEAILTHTTPDDQDVDYFNRFTQQIEAEREVLKQLTTQLNALS
ncbi:MAG: hypothetical protein J6125_01645 [Clostridia bacterium]|nr:hypothetical protein [Clostridia bacterium]